MYKTKSTMSSSACYSFVLIVSILCSLTKCDTTTSTVTSLGEAFNINKVEIDGVVSGGKSIFTDLAPSCFRSEQLTTTTKNFKVYTDHEEFVYEIAASVGLTGEELEGKMDFNSNTHYLKKSNTETHGTIVEVIYLREKGTITHECLEEGTLEPSILHDLNRLPYPIHNPRERANWLPYHAFIHKWGSHILKSSELGAKAIYHTSKTTTAVSDKKELTTKLCGKFPDLNLDGCVDAGPKASSSTDSADESNEVFVLGGSVETQDKLRAGDFSPQILSQLAVEAASNLAPIKHTWFSLPELLLSRVMFETETAGTLQRATSLLSYYKGYHVFGCDHHVVEGRDVTVFVNEGDDTTPNFKCLQLRPGCQTDSDCRNWPIKYLGPCYCAGKGCIAVKKEKKKGTKSLELSLRASPGGRFNDPVNTACRWSTNGGCVCDTAQLQEVWPLGSIPQGRTPTTAPSKWGLDSFVALLALLFVGVGCWIWKGSKTPKPKSE